MRGEFLTFIILLQIKVIGNWFCKPIIFKNLVRLHIFSIRNRLFLICVAGVIKLLEKQALIGLLKFIGIQKCIKTRVFKVYQTKRQVQ